MAKRVPVEGPHGEVVGVLDAVCRVDGLRWGVLRIGGVVRRECGGCACRSVLLVEEVVVDAAVDAAGRQQVLVHRVPGHGDDVLLVPSQEKDVAHHAQVKDAGCMVTSACG